MRPYAQRIAIAEHLGWTKCRLTVRGAGAPERGPSPYGVPPGKNYECSVTPFERDLNAMHEAEKVLHGNNWRPYHDKLAIITVSGPWPAIDATAAQRAEAFLRTIGKWDDTK